MTETRLGLPATRRKWSSCETQATTLSPRVQRRVASATCLSHENSQISTTNEFTRPFRQENMHRVRGGYVVSFENLLPVRPQGAHPAIPAPRNCDHSVMPRIVPHRSAPPECYPTRARARTLPAIPSAIGRPLPCYVYNMLPFSSYFNASSAFFPLK
jgi:hypothetical protein